MNMLFPIFRDAICVNETDISIGNSNEGSAWRRKRRLVAICAVDSQTNTYINNKQPQDGSLKVVHSTNRGADLATNLYTIKDRYV